MKVGSENATTETAGEQVRRWESAVIRVHRQVQEQKEPPSLLAARWILCLCSCGRTVASSAATRCEHCFSWTDFPAEFSLTPASALAFKWRDGLPQ